MEDFADILERGAPSFLISNLSCFSPACLRLSKHEKREYELIKHIDDFCNTQPSIALPSAPVFIISLSGGVDSMVLATIIKGLGYRLVCIHINYNNRDESRDEARFIREWTGKNEIELVFKEIQTRREDCDREKYEKDTHDFRFRLYKETLESIQGARSIILGHHDDDRVENVFNNICRGKSLLGLPVMRKESTTLNVPISRPLIGKPKSLVFEFAHLHGVPYFKNTTPEWSLRGMFRMITLPHLERIYGNVYKNILFVGQQSEQWEDFIHTNILQPFLTTSVTKLDDRRGYKIALDAQSRCFPECFWRLVLSTLHHHMNCAAPSTKSIQNLVSALSASCPIARTMKLSKLSQVQLGEDTLLLSFS